MNEDDLRAAHYVKNPDGSWSKTRLPVGSQVKTNNLSGPVHVATVQAGKPQLHPSENPLVEVSRTGKPLVEVFAAEGKRIRQGEPKPRKWELEWKQMLDDSPHWEHVRAQSFRVRLANGAWYKGDVTACRKGLPRIHVFEVKGGAKMKGVAKGILAIKVAASQYPEICWTLVWKDRGVWRQQEVLP